MFDIMNAEQLINAVRRRTALWDPRHIGHNNRLLINKLWDEVAEEVGTDKNLAKSKWRGLRDYYRQEMKKQTNYITEQGASEYRSSWALFDQMSFVKNTILPRRQRDGIPTFNASADIDVDNNSEFYDDDPINICIPKLEPQLASEKVPHDFKVKHLVRSQVLTRSIIENIPDFMPEHARVSPSPPDYHEQEKPLSAVRRNLKSMQMDQIRARDAARDCEIEIKKRKIAILEKVVEDSDNDDLQFFRSLLPDLANLPRAKKSFIRLKIQEIIHKEVHNNEGIATEESR